MAKIKTALVALTTALLQSAEKHESNPRDFREDDGVLAGIKAGTWAPRIDALTGIVDHIVGITIQGTLYIVRGLGRVGSLRAAYAKGGDIRDKVATLIQAKRIQFLRLDPKTPAAILRKIAADNDAGKKLWTKAEAFESYMGFRADKMTHEAASLTVGYTAALASFLNLFTCDDRIRDPWLAYQADKSNPQVIDGDLAKAAKMVNEHRATVGDMAPDQFGEEYVELCESLTTGTRTKKYVPSRKDVKAGAASIRALGVDLTAGTVADLLGFSVGAMLNATGVTVDSPDGAYNNAVKTLQMVEAARVTADAKANAKSKAEAPKRRAASGSARRRRVAKK